MSKKFAFIVFAALIGSVAQANTLETVYQKNTILPLTLQAVVLNDLSAKCPQGLSQYGLKEESTTSQKSVVNGQDVILYSTVFDSRYFFDGTHPQYTKIEVQSLEVLAAVPASQRYQALSVSGQACQ